MWTYVKQPNNRIARFDYELSRFTQINMTKTETYKESGWVGGWIPMEEFLETMISSDTLIDGTKPQNDGLNRWREATRLIEEKHGKTAVQRVIDEINEAQTGVFVGEINPYKWFCPECQGENNGRQSDDINCQNCGLMVRTSLANDEGVMRVVGCGWRVVPTKPTSWIVGGDLDGD